MNQTDFREIAFFWRYGVALLALALFIFIWLFNLNTPLFYWVNSWHLLANSTFWAALTSMGDTAITLPLTLLVLRYMPAVFPPMLITTLITPIVLHTIKNLADAARPGALISPVDFYYVEPLYTAHSFPSGHSTTIFAWACVIILQMQPSTQKLWGYILLAFTLLTGLSRIIVGAHWPMDVFFGAALGWSLSVLATWLAIKWSWINSPKAQQWSMGFFIVLTLISLFFIDIDYKMITSWHRVLMVVCLMFALFPWIDKSLRKILQIKAEDLHKINIRSAIKDTREFCIPLINPLSKVFSRLSQKHKRWLLHGSILLLLVLLVSSTIGWHSLIQPWREIDLVTAVFSILLMLVSYLVRTMRLVSFFQEIPWLRFLDCLRLSLVHNFYNNLLPMRSGELSFPLLMSREFQVPYEQSIAALIWLRVLDFFALALIGCFALLIILKVEFLAIAVIIFGALLPLWLARVFQLITQKVHNAKPAWEPKLKLFQQGMPAQRNEIWKSWGWTFLNWSIKMLSLAVIFSCFIPLDYAYSMIAILGAELSSVLPIHSIAGFGTYESGALAALALVGESPKNAVVAVINLHLFVLSIAVISGLIAMLFKRSDNSTNLPSQSNQANAN